jgi:hypothetical protein
MKKLLLLSITAMTAVIAQAGQFEKKVDPFTSVVVTGNYTVTLIESTEEKVIVYNEDSLVTDEKILVTNDGSALDIRLKGDTYKLRHIEIEVYYKNVYTIEARRGCIVTLDNVLKGDVITFRCQMGGQVKGTIEATTARLSISGDGLIDVKGTATIAELEVTTGGTLHAVQLKTESTSAKVSAGGSITCTASKKLAMKAVGGSISYRGTPETIEQSDSMGGKIIKLKDE